MLWLSGVDARWSLLTGLALRNVIVQAELLAATRAAGQRGKLP